MTERLPGWEKIAGVLAERLQHAAARAGSISSYEIADADGCGHREAEADPDSCPFCADRAAYQLWERKAGRR